MSCFNMAYTDNYDSTPCLLDDLMDNHIIKCDIDFGSTLLADTDTAGFTSKASPSHQSDSGCSDMSDEIRSVSPGCNDSPFLDFDPFECDSTEQDLDKELEMYFATPASNVPSKQKEEESLQTPINVDEMISELYDRQEDEDTSDEDYVPPLKKMGPRVVHTKRVARKINVSESSVVSSASSLSTHPAASTESTIPRPAVKVVKVIKTPAVSKNDINNSIMQALDERNKKNAVQAKLNREKKKAYIKNLEEEIDELKTENFVLKETNKKAERDTKALVREVEYLRSVLANDSALSGLIKNINHSKKVKLSSEFRRKRSADHDHDYQVSKKSRVGAGVCLHVDQGDVSLEFCSKCSTMASNEES